MSKIYLKNKEEIQRMRQAGMILQEAQKAVIQMAREGVSLLELDEAAERTILKLGGAPAFKGFHGFPGTLCTMLNSEVVHAIPDMRKLKNGDLLSVDCGVLYKDLNSDAAFSMVIGGDKENERRAKFSNCVKSALEAGCQAAVVGNRLGDIGYAVESVIKQGGYSVIKEYTGHGIGYELHEDPHVFNYGKPHSGMEIKEGMTLCIEPIVAEGSVRNKTLKDGWTVVTKDGRDACQWEHCGVVTKKGFEVFA